MIWLMDSSKVALASELSSLVFDSESVELNLWGKGESVVGRVSFSSSREMVSKISCSSSSMVWPSLRTKV